MRLAALALLAACGTHAADHDVVGPYTGPSTMFFVDRITLPVTSTDARAFADDLDGNRTTDNELGACLAALASQNDVTTHAADMIAARTVMSTLAIQANDLSNDDSVAVRFFGADGDPAVMELGGTLVGGRFTSNRTRGDHAGQTTLHLPALEDADPITIVLHDMEIDLTPDGHNGFDGVVRGLVGPEIIEVASKSILQMIENNPADHHDLIGIFENGSQPLDLGSIENSQLVTGLLEPDIHRDGVAYVSFGYAVHFAPTPANADSWDHCHDRAPGAAETGIDCGGSCASCAGGQICTSDADCQSRHCNGTCLPVSCTDGTKDGIESDVDCGGFECSACSSGRACTYDGDCASKHCSMTGSCE